jgi:DNA-binding MarR family transcriptional regulator
VERIVKRPSQDEYESAAALRIGLRRFLSHTEQITSAYGLTPERYELLLLIKTSPDGDATVGRLGKLLSIGQSAATQLARRVEDLGLIERTVSPRAARVHPRPRTPEGERRLAEALAALEEERTTLAAVFAELTPALRPVAEQATTKESSPARG